MPNYYVTGVLGAGKSLVAVSRIREYLWEGRKVATNLDLFSEHLQLGDNNKTASIIRLPDKPRVQDLESIGLGHDEPKANDKRNGILVLDELATWLNSRDWRDKERGAVINWMMHARKLRWDVYLLIQDVDMVDAQLRDSLCDHYVRCSRLDRLKVLGIKPPRVHVAHIYYGGKTGISVGRWVYRGTDLYQAYDTEQTFTLDELWLEGHNEPTDMRASYSVLPPWYLIGRYLEPVKPKRSIREWARLALTYAVFAPAHLLYMLAVGRDRYLSEMKKCKTRSKKVVDIKPECGIL